MSMPSPIIFTAGAFSLRWYGVFAALACLTFYLLMAVRCRRIRISASQIADLMLLIIISGLAGARLEFVRRFWSDYFADDLLGIFRVWEGGLVFQGGFIMAAIACIIYCVVKKFPIGEVADLVALALPAAHAVARIGCFLNGCCFGRPCRPGFGVVYGVPESGVIHIQRMQGLIAPTATAPLPVVPVQLLESLWCVMLALLIFWMERRRILDHRRFFVYVLLYPVGRFALEFLRGDYCPPPSGLTPAQSTTLFVVLPAVIVAMAVTSARKIPCYHR